MTQPTQQPEPSPELVAAYEAGWAAHLDGEPSTSCPYPAGSDERLVWVRGYTKHRSTVLSAPSREEV